MSNTPNFGLPRPVEDANVDDEFRRLQDAWDLIDAILTVFQAGIAGKSSLGHLHTIAEITGLAAALAGKMDASKTFRLGDLSDVQGAGDASVGYILSKAVDGYVLASAASLLGNHAHTVAQISGLSEALAGKSNTGHGHSISAITGLQEQLQAIAELLADPWATQPVGSFVMVDDGTDGVVLAGPPTNKAYRYVDLSAGETGAGRYNNGVLSNEIVSGVVPLVTATAVVNLASSPFYGRTVRLVNTERRFLRPGTGGVLEESQNLAHSHGVIDPGHVHSVYGTSIGSGSANIELGGANDQNGGSTIRAYTGITIASDGGAEARPRNKAVRVLWRIK